MLLGFLIEPQILLHDYVQKEVKFLGNLTWVVSLLNSSNRDEILQLVEMARLIRDHLLVLKTGLGLDAVPAADSLERKPSAGPSDRSQGGGNSGHRLAGDGRQKSGGSLERKPVTGSWEKRHGGPTCGGSWERRMTLSGSWERRQPCGGSWERSWERRHGTLSTASKGAQPEACCNLIILDVANRDSAEESCTIICHVFQIIYGDQSIECVDRVRYNYTSPPDRTPIIPVPHLQAYAMLQQSLAVGCSGTEEGSVVLEQQQEYLATLRNKLLPMEIQKIAAQLLQYQLGMENIWIREGGILTDSFGRIKRSKSNTSAFSKYDSP
ncbi:hypothetical protein XELAEV_18046368mg [Xenopus laevis]|uniref:Cerebral cavernous malformations 2 harmonin-homology domain-containing protein n=1 Tax=Xenopus laevis TaxID=8355 RepID=A0A974BT60_XENLA|nr:hypothetical protein XELAEV_18046368mg [Xenopus laevis]